MELSGTGFWHAKGAFRRRLIPLLLLLASFLMASLLLRLAFRTDFVDDVAINGGSNDSLISSAGRNNTTATTTTTAITVSGLHRKLLKHASTVAAVKQPNRIPGDRCTNLDIVISQGATTPLPNGIPTYTVEIQNQCFSGCSISRIHLSCGWFSSATMINPLVFKRLAYNDCLVNDGKPLPCGVILSFQYANTFSYPLSVTSVFC